MRRSSSPGRILVVLTVTLLISGVLLALAQDDGGAPADQPAPLSGTVTYTVKSGDVLDTIAARFDVSVDCVAQMNDLVNRGRIFPGNTLTISDQCPLYDGLMPVLNPRPGRESVSPGQQGGAEPAPTLDISGGTTYVVEDGDTLAGIAERFDVSLQALGDANGRPEPLSLRAGMTLIIPANAPPFGVVAPPDTNTTGAGVTRSDEIIYRVQPRDVLDLIAASFGAQRLCIADRNSLTKPWTIFPGQTLIIPADCPPYDGLSIVYTPNPAAIIPNPLANQGGGAATPVRLTQQPLQVVSPTPEQFIQPTQETFTQPTPVPPAATMEAVG